MGCLALAWGKRPAIGTRRSLRPLAPASQRMRSSTRPRLSESVIRSGRPSGPVTASPHTSARQPVQERQHHAVVVEQGVGGDHRSLALEPEVLVPGLDRWRPPRSAPRLSGMDPDPTFHIDHDGHLHEGDPSAKGLNSAFCPGLARPGSCRCPPTALEFAASSPKRGSSRPYTWPVRPLSSMDRAHGFGP